MSTFEETAFDLEKLQADLREARRAFKRPALPKARKIGWFERWMNRRGWYRQTEFFVIDSDMLFCPTWRPFTLRDFEVSEWRMKEWT